MRVCVSGQSDAEGKVTDRSGCGGGDSLSSRSGSPAQRHQTEERSGEEHSSVSLSLSVLSVSLTECVCVVVCSWTNRTGLRSQIWVSVNRRR